MSHPEPDAASTPSTSSPSPAQLLRWIDDYEADAPRPARWIAGLSREECLAHPVPGTWSVQELVVHVLESDLVATHRFRRIVAEPLPILYAYDETAFVQRLDYGRVDLAQACDLFALNRRFTAAWLRTVAPGDFERAGIHTQRGKVALWEFLRSYVHHPRHHETFLLAKREKLGKPLV